MTQSRTAGTMRLMGYGAAVLVSSAGGLVLEIVAGRLLAPYVGMSLYTWTAIIAVVLAGFSVGHWIGGVLAGPDCDRVAGARRVAYALALAATSSFATLGLLRLLAGPLLSADLPALTAIITLAALLFFLPSLFVGIVSPILTKLAVDDAAAPGPVIGRMYALSAVGSIAGTLAAGYIFISWIGSTGTVIAVAVAYAILAALFAVPGRIFGTTAALLAILGGGFSFANWRLGVLDGPCTVESDYYCLRIDDFSRLSGRPSAVLVLDHLAHGINDRDDPRFLHSDYLKFIAEQVRRRFPTGTQQTRVLLVGGGALTFSRAIVAERSDASVLVAEIDPAVTHIAQTRLWAAPHERIRVVHDDARRTVQALTPEPQFELVLTDVFHDIAMPAHLVTREFHQELRRRLTANGIYAVNVIEGGGNPRFLRSFVRTLEADFPVVEVWADGATLGKSTRTTYVVLAGFQPSPGDRLAIDTGLWLRLPAVPLTDEIILTDDFAPVDRLLAHILLDRNLGER